MAPAQDLQRRTGSIENPTPALAGANVQQLIHVVPLTVGLAPDVAFARALDAAQRMGWTIVASDKPAGRIEASQRSRWMGFTDDIIVRVTPASSGSRIDLRSSSRYGRSDFGVNAARIRDYLTALRAATTSQG